MKPKSRFSTVLLTVAGLTFFNTLANAATVPAPVSGDLYVGFRVTGGVGNGTAYLVKLGLDTSIFNLANASLGTPIQLSLGNLGLDLVNTFGTGAGNAIEWYNRPDLLWGVFGNRPSANSIVYGSRARTNVAFQSTPWNALDSTGRNGTSNQITSVLTSTGGYQGSDATVNSAVATLQTTLGSAASYITQVTASGTDFGSLSQWTTIEGSFANGSAGAVLDLYRIGSAVTYPGSFTINDSGAISFTAPVPEPTTTALLAITGSLFAGLRRRRAISNN